MLWGCVATSGTGNISQVNERMYYFKYQQILEANVTVNQERKFLQLKKCLQSVKSAKDDEFR